MFDELILTESVMVALRTAAVARDADQPLGTSDVFLALLRNDASIPWDYLTLHTGDYHQLAGRRQPDREGPATGRWHGVPLTPALTQALAYAEELARGYHYLPVPPGLLALALVAEPGSGATRMMVEGTDLTHVALVDLVHDNVLGDRLVDSPIFPPWNRATGVADPRTREAAALAPPDHSVDWSGVGPGAFELLRAAALRSDEPLRERLKLIVLDDDEVFDRVAPKLGGLADHDADAVLDRARDRFETSRPDPAQVVAAATIDPSDKVRHFCWFLGLDASEVAALASSHALETDRRSGLTGAALALMGLVMVLNLAVSGLVVANAMATGQWLRLGLIWLVWAGHPTSSIRVGLVTVLVLGWLVAPLVGAVHLVGVMLELAWARAERQMFWGQTGVRLSLRKYRRQVQRLSGRLAGMQELRHRSALLRRLPAS